ncbi:hypothetical protein ACCO45_009327 [Purpureocillium lilacinum]|uniref:Uncharacterized protein n=1 Tax=Purpureocillium lilacinum TaxID=33203 RepID=A0ACC4DJM1_PURLI
MPPTLRRSNRRPLLGTCPATTLFRIPAELTADAGDPGPLLAKLPTELLTQVFAEAEPVDSILLALSCKALLGIAALCHLTVPDPTRHRQQWSPRHHRIASRRANGFWAAQLARTDTSGWSRPEGELWQSSVKWFAAGIKVQCPDCRLAEHVQEERKEAMRARG